MLCSQTPSRSTTSASHSASCRPFFHLDPAGVAISASPHGQLLSFTVDGDRFWRVVSETQDIRYAVRRGRYPSVLLTDRPITLERYDTQTTHWLLEQHEILREMLVGGERFFVWTRAATTGRNELVDIRRYACELDEFQRRVKEAGIELPPPVHTTKRDMRRPWH